MFNQRHSSSFQTLLIIFLVVMGMSSCSRPIRHVDEPTVTSSSLTTPTPRWKENVQKQKEDVIILDPGHGGRDLGTHSSALKYQEKSLALTTTLLVRDYLRRWGYNVVLTRDRDIFIPLEKRASLANKRLGSIFVSIHYNSSPNATANGVEIFCHRPERKGERDFESNKLGHAILKEMISNTKMHSRGVKEANYSVLRQTKMPAVLIEGGFLTNTKERDQLKNPKNIHTIAQGIARGIDEYMHSRKK
jgi:N-acetylmuramoyl-L-alanine amidase